MTVIIGIIVVDSLCIWAYMAPRPRAPRAFDCPCGQKHPLAELIIIAGSSTGAFVIANPPTLLSHVPKDLTHAFKKTTA